LDESAGSLSDFYNYGVVFGRYKAISLQPGSLTDTIDDMNFGKMKIIVMDLRSKVVEQRIIIAKPGCGDAKYDSSLGTEQCDDGNVINGDGCDQNCQVETDWSCTTSEGQQSVCHYVFCGNGELDVDEGEECDDGNYVSGDGCSNCREDLGYLCDPFDTCVSQCGNGKVYYQYKNDANGD
jgi:cysteine-rich repeat protein